MRRGEVGLDIYQSAGPGLRKLDYDPLDDSRPFANEYDPLGAKWR